MKKYENPMLQVVSIKRNNVISTSGEGGTLGVNLNTDHSGDVYAPGRNFEE